jgi:hypothetical protein
MFTDEETRHLLHLAADTIPVSANVVPLTSPSRTWPRAALAAAAVLVLSGGAVAHQMATRDDMSFVTDEPDSTVPVTVGAVVVGHLPSGWKATTQVGSDIAADSCLGPESERCAVRLLSVFTPTRDSGIPWFSLLTEPCISSTSTTVLMEAAAFSAGPGQAATLRCAGPGGIVHNTAWVLDAGVAVIPSSADYSDQALQVMSELRFAAGTPPLPPPAPSQHPSRSRTAS